MRKIALLIGIIAVVVGLFLGRSRPAIAQQLFGSGTWQSRSGEVMRGTWSVALSQAGKELEGTIMLTGSTLFSEGTVSGTTDGERIMLGVMSEGVNHATFSGSLRGESVSGRWECPTLMDAGEWEGILRDSESGS